MARPAVGSVLRRATRRGTSFYLRVTWSDPAAGETTRLLVPLGGGWGAGMRRVSGRVRLRAHDPVFATRNGRRNTVDNVRRTIVAASVERANELLAARDQRQIARGTPHTLRRTFASILAELNLPPRRAMYLLGHTDPTLMVRVYQQVIDMGDGGVQMLETVIGCILDEALALLSGRGVLSTNCPPSRKNASQPGPWSGLEGVETAR
jgi:Phage integrase family